MVTRGSKSLARRLSEYEGCIKVDDMHLTEVNGECSRNGLDMVRLLMSSSTYIVNCLPSTTKVSVNDKGLRE
jgi:hypothetical protein